MSKNRTHGAVWGLFGALVALTVIVASTPAHAGVVTKANTTKAAAGILSSAAGAAAGAAVAGAIGGPVTAGVAAAAAGAGAAAAGITYAAVTQGVQHPVAAAQTLIATNPLTGPGYIISHPSAVIKGVKDIVKWLF